jgi:hypothetical protein
MAKSNSLIFAWMARIAALVFSIFISTFSLLNVNSDSLTAGLIGLFWFNLPVLIMIAIIILAWKKPLIGIIGQLLLAIGLAMFVISSPVETDNIFVGLFFSVVPTITIAFFYLLQWITLRQAK